MAVHSAFTGLTTAKTWGQSQYLTPGKYLLRLKEFSQHESVDPKKGNAFFFFAIWEVIVAHYTPTQDPKYKSEDEVAWSINMTNPSGKNNLINFLTDFFKKEGYTQKSFDEAFMEKLFEKNFFALGREMMATAYQITTQKGEPFTKVDWEMYVEPTEEEVAVQVAAAQAEVAAAEQAQAAAQVAAPQAAAQVAAQ